MKIDRKYFCDKRSYIFSFKKYNENNEFKYV